MSLHLAPMMGLDLETTGVNRQEDRIVSFAAVFQAPNTEDAKITGIVDPGIEIPEGAAKVHGITTEKARNEGLEPAVATQALVSALSTAMQTRMPIVVFNAPFDLTMLREEAVRHLGHTREQWGEGLWPIYDPMVVDKQIDPYRKGRRTLEATAAHYGVEFPEELKHTALGDVMVTLQIARKQLQQARPGATFQSLHADQRVWKASQAANFRQYLQKQGKPADDVSGEWPTESYVAPYVAEAGGMTW